MLGTCTCSVLEAGDRPTAANLAPAWFCQERFVEHSHIQWFRPGFLAAFVPQLQHRVVGRKLFSLWSLTEKVCQLLPCVPCTDAHTNSHVHTSGVCRSTGGQCQSRHLCTEMRSGPGVCIELQTDPEMCVFTHRRHTQMTDACRHVDMGTCS